MKEQPRKMRPPTPIPPGPNPLWYVLALVATIVFTIAAFAGLVPETIIYVVVLAVVLRLIADMRLR
jgi:hypothetical protein